MSLFGFLFLLFIASITGSLGAHIAGRKGMGCLASIVLGFIGALIGTFIARELHLPLSPYIRFGSHNFPIIWSVFGAALFVAFLNLLAPRKETRDSK
ncbi:MAG: GlsB/YeaQ/YmgE family stress response membrane protein [Acidobacteriota bacterium]